MITMQVAGCGSLRRRGTRRCGRNRGVALRRMWHHRRHDAGQHRPRIAGLRRRCARPSILRMLLVLSVTLAACVTTGGTTPPAVNIAIIVADDLGTYDLSAMGPSRRKLPSTRILG